MLGLLKQGAIEAALRPRPCPMCGHTPSAPAVRAGEAAAVHEKMRDAIEGLERALGIEAEHTSMRERLKRALTFDGRMTPAAAFEWWQHSSTR